MKFTSEQKEALWEAAWHWLENYEAAATEEYREIKIRHDSCACCKKWIETVCNECPISQYSKQTLCAGTPWDEVWYEYNYGGYGSEYENEESLDEADKRDLIEAIRQEYEFLVTLAFEEEYEL